jgi:AraC-like DNA-binding protein
MTFQSYHDYIDFIAKPRMLVVEKRELDPLGLSMLVSHQPPGDHSDVPIAEWTLFGILSGTCTAQVSHGGPKKEFAINPKIAAVVPPRTGTDTQVFGDHSLWLLSLAERDVRRGLGLGGSDAINLGRMLEPDAESDLVSLLARNIWEALGNPAANALHVETLIDALVVSAYRDGHAADPAVLRKASRKARDFRALIDYVQDNIASPLTLAELSMQAGLSSAELTRAFKARMGLPLHQYVLQARLARARALLADARLSLAQIAYEAGFSSQAHMTSTFTRMIGATPGKLRAASGKKVSDEGLLHG